MKNNFKNKKKNIYRIFDFTLRSLNYALVTEALLRCFSQDSFTYQGTFLTLDLVAARISVENIQKLT